MTVTVLRSHLSKLGPQIIIYRDYKNFSNEKFQPQMYKMCEKFQNIFELDSFLNIRNTAFYETAPLKQKYTSANNSRFRNYSKK